MSRRGGAGGGRQIAQLKRELHDLREQRTSEALYGVERFMRDPYLDAPRDGQIDPADADPVMQILLRDKAPAQVVADEKGVVALTDGERRAAVAARPMAELNARMNMHVREHADSLDRYLEDLEKAAETLQLDSGALVEQRRAAAEAAVASGGGDVGDDELMQTMQQMQALSMEPGGKERGWKEQLKLLEKAYRRKHKRAMPEKAKQQAQMMYLQQFTLQEKLHPPNAESFPPIIRLKYTQPPREPAIAGFTHPDPRPVPPRTPHASPRSRQHQSRFHLPSRPSFPPL